MHELDPDDLDPTLHGGDDAESDGRANPKPIPTSVGGDTFLEGTIASDSDSGGASEQIPPTVLDALRQRRRAETMLSSGAPEVPPQGSQRAAAPVSLVPGASVGSYRLKKVVGKGAQGSVWRAFNEVAERDFALKFINTELVSAKWAIDGIRSEASVLFDLTHPGIVRLNNIEQVGPHIFLVMEFLGGPSLQGVHRRRFAADPDTPAFEVDECLWILERLAPALDYATAAGVTHRDIKPGNVMFTNAFDQDENLTEAESEIKLCDFGIAFVNQQVAEGDEVRPTGTPPYMAPEVIAGVRPDHRADIYSMAATLYHLHCGSPPVRARTLDEIHAKLKAGDFKPIDSGNKPFDAAIMKALSFDPDARQGSFDEFLYEASNHALGTQAVMLGPWPKIIAGGAMLLAAGAVTFALDPFGIRRGQAEFLFDPGIPMRDGTPVVTGATSALAFNYRSPGDEEVGVAVDDGETIYVRPVESGEDRYEVTVDLPSEGPHTIKVSTVDGASLLGQSDLIVDRTVTLPVNAVTVEGVGPHPASEPIVVTFRVGEDGVEVQDLGVVPAMVLDLEWSQRQARHTFLVPSEENDDEWAVTREFLFRDPYGNEEKGRVEFKVYAKRTIVARLRSDFPVGADAVHEWDLAAMDAAMNGWKVRVQSASIPEDAKRGLIADRQKMMDAVASRLANPDEPTLALALTDGAWQLRDGADGSEILYTRSADLMIAGSTVGARSPELTAIVDGTGITKTGEPAVNRVTGDFAVALSLAPGADGHLRVSLPGSSSVAPIRIVLDDTAPVLKRESPANLAAMSTTSVEVVFVIQDDRSGLQEVVLVGLPGEEIPMVRDDTGDRWRASVRLPADGEHRVHVRAKDWVGNVAQEDLVLVRDMTAPAWNNVAPTAINATTGSPLTLTWKFDETIHEARATITFLDDNGAPMTSSASVGEPRADGSTVDLEIPLPFEPMSKVTVELTVADVLGNESEKVTYSTPVTHDPWGAVPGFIRSDAMAILDGDELVELLGDELGAELYVIDGSSRFPRCIRHRRTGMVFVYVSAGTFEYGPPGRGTTVEMSGFYIGRTEVSGEQFVAGADIEGYKKAEFESSQLPILTKRKDAGTWCQRLEFVLPTEAQWEYAASGPRNATYPWGDEPNEELRNGPSSQRLGSMVRVPPVEVDAFPAGRSWCGAIQMARNFAEICRDNLDPESMTDTTDPVGDITSQGSGYVIRGGSANTRDSDSEKTHFRASVPPNDSYKKAGFRPVWPLSSSR